MTAGYFGRFPSELCCSNVPVNISAVISFDSMLHRRGVYMAQHVPSSQRGGSVASSTRQTCCVELRRRNCCKIIQLKNEFFLLRVQGRCHTRLETCGCVVKLDTCWQFITGTLRKVYFCVTRLWFVHWTVSPLKATKSETWHEYESMLQSAHSFNTGELWGQIIHHQVQLLKFEVVKIKIPAQKTCHLLVGRNKHCERVTLGICGVFSHCFLN